MVCLRWALIVTGALPLLGCAERYASAPQPQDHPVVRAYVDHYNNRQLDALLSSVTQDVTWIESAGSRTETVAEGRQEFGGALFGQFEFPGPKIHLTGDWWQADDLIVVGQIQEWHYPDEAVWMIEGIAIFDITPDKKIARIVDIHGSDPWSELEWAKPDPDL